MLTLYNTQMSLRKLWLHSLGHWHCMQSAYFVQTSAHTKARFHNFQIDVLVFGPWPMRITDRSKTSAQGTWLMSFINPLSVENHYFDGMELGSYIVYWSMIKYHDWRWNTSIYSLEFCHIENTLKLYGLPQALFSHGPSWSCLIYLSSFGEYMKHK